MKKVVLIITLFMFNNVINAQTIEEWTQQKQTQIKYLLNQVAANKVYIEYLQKGYSIASKGLSTIGQIKNGEFTLHQDFFNGLLSINPAVKNWSKVAGIIALQIQLIKQATKGFNHIKELGQLTTAEMEYCNAMINNLFSDCDQIIQELLMVTIEGNREMKDDERIQRIDRLYGNMQDNYTFCTALNNQMQMLSVQRMHEQSAIHRDKILNEVK